VTLAAAKDTDDINGTATIRLSASGITAKDITATEIDNDIVSTIAEAPQANETVKIEVPYTIRWRTTGTLNKVHIKVIWSSSGTPEGYKYIIKNLTNTGSYNWTPDIVNDQCQLIFERSDTGKEVGRSGTFKIVN